MRILHTFAFLYLLNAIAGQVVKDQTTGNHVIKPLQQHQHHNSDQQKHEINSQQLVNKEQHIDVASEQQQVVQQVVAEPSKVGEKAPQTSVDSKLTGKIPAKVQQIVTQVSQHIPQVIQHHLANKQRTVRSVKNRRDWREMQVNPVAQPGKCEFICNPVDSTVCGHNGNCYFEFASQCDLSTYNCLNTQKIFHIVDFAQCQDLGASKCYRGDL